MFIARVLVGVLCAACVSAQVITTVAGTDFVFPNTVPALNAPLGPVSSVATDAAGNVYAADGSNQIIVQISPNGTLTVVAGNGLLGAGGDGIAATSASLNQPGLVALDSAGNIYFYDAGRVREVSKGIVTTIAGVAGNNGYSGDGGPATSALLNYSGSGLVVDSAGAVYISDNNTCRVRKIASGIINTIAGNGQCAFSGDGGPGVSASLNTPVGLALDLTGNLYIADVGNGRIRKVSSGMISTVAGGPNGDTSGNLSAVTGITVDSSGNLYIAVYSANRIFKVSGGVLTPYAGNGNMGLAGDGGPALSASLNNPYGIAFDASGNLYIADVGNARIRRVTANQIMGPVAGNGGFKFSGDGGPAMSATFDQPTSVALDAAGNIYIADSGNNRIRKVSNGVVTTFAGNGVPAYTGDGGPATSASLNQPFAVALDSSGAVYIADYGNSVVRKVSGGTITTVAGNGNGGFSGDGGPAKAASLAGPAGVAVDSIGNLYIADAQNDRIRKVSNGIITTVAGNGTEAFSGDGGPAASASLQINQYYFVGLAVDAVGNLYIADSGNSRIRVVSGGSGGSGMITTVVGNGQSNSSGDGGPVANASISGPAGLALDQDGSLYISDSGGNRVRKVSTGTITTFAGNGSYSFSGDGGPATAAGLYSLTGLALDPVGNLFIAEANPYARIREVLKTAPSFQVSPSVINVSAISGGISPAAKVGTLSSSTIGLPYTTFSSANWLSVNPPAGNTPASLQVIVDPSQLLPGGYFGTVSISAPNALPTTQTLTVNLTVKPAVPGLLLPNSQTLSFAVTQMASPQTSQLTLSNNGSGSARFTAGSATSSGGNWLQVSPSSGTVTAAMPAALSVTANPGSLPAGTYSGSIMVASADTGQNLVIPVTLAINAPQPEILLSQSGLTFTAVAQGGNPLPQSLAVLNTGAGTLNFSATPNLQASGWLTVSPGNGTVNRPFLDVSFLDVSVDASALTAGTYYGQVLVNATGASNSPQVATVILIVLPPGSNPGPDVSPIGLVFTGVAGAANPPSQSIAVANVTANPVAFGSGVAPSTATFVKYRPTNATVLPNLPAQIDVQPDFSMLAAGPNRAALTLLFDDNTIRTVSILAVVAPTGTSTTSESRESPRLTSGCTPTKLLPEFTLVGYSSNATLGYPAVVAAKIVDDCGLPMTQGSVMVSFSNGDAQLALLSLQDGTWTNSWQPGNAAANVTLTLRASVPAQNLAGTTQAASVSLQQGSQTPPILFGAPFGAGTQAQGPFSPGDVILVKGNGLATGQGTATGTPLQNQLAGASLVIGARNAPLLYADSGQVIGLVPPDVPVNASQQVLLLRGNAYGNPVSVIIAPTHPAILTQDGSGKGQGLVYNAGALPTTAATTLADGTNPVAVGGPIMIYCTGLGATDASGRVSNPVALSIGGQPAQVSYAGVALPQAYPASGAPMLLGLVSGGLGGLYQITATVPAGVVNGPVAVTISSAGQTSQLGVTLGVTGGVSGSSGPPAIMAVVNAATQIDATHGVAPNSFISVYSSNIGTATNTNLFPATSFQGLEVLFNGNPAPLYAAVPPANQINVVVPSELPGTGTATVNVQNSAGMSANVALTLAKDSVGVFRIADTAHPNNAAVELTGTFEIVMPASTAASFGFATCTTPVTSTCAQPAKPGDNIVIFFTGGGLATPNGDPAGQPVLTGSVAPLNGTPLYKTVQTPTLTIGGLPATVQFSGIAPGTAAEYQLNTQIPAGVQPGDSVPVVLTFANSSDTVTLAVRAP